jgi:putative ABC transport system ATP-binding protein
LSSQSFLYEVQKITKGYTKGGEKVNVLADLNLSIKEGEFISIMGPSGSGKSTLFNVLGGLDRPDTGRVAFLGKDIQNFSSGEMDRWRARQVGFIFQFYHLIPVLTAYQNVEIPLLLTALSPGERKKKIETALSLLGIEARAKHCHESCRRSGRRAYGRPGFQNFRRDWEDNKATQQRFPENHGALYP